MVGGVAVAGVSPSTEEAGEESGEESALERLTPKSVLSSMVGMVAVPGRLGSGGGRQRLWSGGGGGDPTLVADTIRRE